MAGMLESNSTITHLSLRGEVSTIMLYRENFTIFLFPPVGVDIILRTDLLKLRIVFLYIQVVSSMIRLQSLSVK